MGSQELTCGSGPALEVGCRTDGCNMMQPFVLRLLCMCATQSILARGAPNEQILGSVMSKFQLKDTDGLGLLPRST